jgi:hypothetical protein
MGTTTVNISANQVKELRDKTGAPMMDCKHALTEAKGDLEQAVVLLRKKGISKADKKAGRGYHELVDMGLIEIEPLTYIRGRSIPNQFIIVDEAQNLTPHEVKTIITRAGEGTKIVFTGDIHQIDQPYLDALDRVDGTIPSLDVAD